MKTKFLSALLISAVLLTGCKVGGSSGPTPPPPPGSDVTHLFSVLLAPNATSAAAAAKFHSLRAMPMGSRTGRVALAVSPDAVPAVVGCPGIGTITNDEASLPYWPVKTCENVYANLSEANTAQDIAYVIPPVANYQVFFEDATCSSPVAWSRESPGMSGKALIKGFLFLMDLQGTGPTDPDNWWFVLPDQTDTSQPVNVGSMWDSSNTCTASPTTLTGVYKTVRNDDPLALGPDGNGGTKHLSGLSSVGLQGPLFTGTP